VYLAGIKEVIDCKNTWSESFKIGESSYPVRKIQGMWNIT